MAKQKSPAAEQQAERYRITLKAGAKIQVGGVWLRADRSHEVSASVYLANTEKIESHAAL